MNLESGPCISPGITKGRDLDEISYVNAGEGTMKLYMGRKSVFSSFPKLLEDLSDPMDSQ